MSEPRYNMTTASRPFTMRQGVTFCKRWQFRFKATGLPFPLFSDLGEALWKGRCMFRTTAAALSSLLALTTENSGVTLDYVDDVVTGIRAVYYGLYITATQASALPAGKIVYDIELERLSDGWVICPQEGKVTVGAEVTK